MRHESWMSSGRIVIFQIVGEVDREGFACFGLNGVTLRWDGVARIRKERRLYGVTVLY